MAHVARVSRLSILDCPSVFSKRLFMIFMFHARGVVHVVIGNKVDCSNLFSHKLCKYINLVIKWMWPSVLSRVLDTKLSVWCCSASKDLVQIQFS